MQTVEYTIETPESPAPLTLWRAIPVRIIVSGVADPAGEWTFLLGNNWDDQTLLSGTVTRDGSGLAVTLETMDSAPLTGAIRGEEMLACTATLTDGSSQVYLIPVFIRNRATGAPLPGTGGPGEAAAASSDGLEIVTLASGEIPAPGKVYAFAPADDVEMEFPDPAEDRTNGFRLRLTMPDPAVTVTWPAGLVWGFAVPELSAGTTSELAFTWNGGNWEGWAVPDMSGYAQLSGGNTFSGLQTVNGILDVRRVPGENYSATLRLGDNSTFYCQITADGQRIGFGYSATASGNFGSLAVGYQASATGGYGCLAVGQGVLNPARYSAAIGKYNVATDAPLVIGNGTGTADRKNIAVIDWSGNLTLSGDVTFTPAGGTATSLAALVARIETLEQRA